MHAPHVFLAILLASAAVAAAGIGKVWPDVVIHDAAGDVKVSNFGDLPNVSTKSFDITQVSFNVRNGVIKVTFKCVGKPVTVEEVGVGKQSKFMFSYSLMAAAVVNGTLGDVTVSYDNVVPSRLEAATLSILAKGTAYVRNGNVSLEGNTLTLTFEAPPGFEGLGEGTVTAMALMQSNRNALTGAYDETTLTLGGGKTASAPQVGAHRFDLNKYLPWIIGGLAFIAAVTGLGYYLFIRE
ncbi:MAG: hypothetical protein J7L55_00250 [Desulfurococcales archaeon]|nr:hypothetical protein [Desulfurococcales archaeon]